MDDKTYPQLKSQSIKPAAQVGQDLPAEKPRFNKWIVASLIILLFLLVFAVLAVVVVAPGRSGLSKPVDTRISSSQSMTPAKDKSQVKQEIEALHEEDSLPSEEKQLLEETNIDLSDIDAELNKIEADLGKL